MRRKSSNIRFRTLLEVVQKSTVDKFTFCGWIVGERAVDGRYVDKHVVVGRRDEVIYAASVFHQELEA